MDDSNFETSMASALHNHDGAIVLFTAIDAKYGCYYYQNLSLEFQQVHSAAHLPSMWVSGHCHYYCV